MRDEIELLDAMTATFPRGVSFQDLGPDAFGRWTVTGHREWDGPEGHATEPDGGWIHVNTSTPTTLHVSHYGQSRAEAMAGCLDLYERRDDLLASTGERDQ